MIVSECIESLIDSGMFVEYDKDMMLENFFGFFDYFEKFEKDCEKINLSEVIVMGEGDIEGIKVVVVVMDLYFCMGSMGFVVGEKIICVIEKVKEMYVLFFIFIVLGGVCM